MNTPDKVYFIIEKLSNSGYFRAEYADDGYISITTITDDSYEVNLQEVSFFDQPIHNLHHFDSQELTAYLEKHIEQIGQITSDL